MSRELKINLTDEQCDALANEAKQNGLKFFDHCRVKLLDGLMQPLRIDAPLQMEPYGRSPAMDALPETAEGYRLTRLEQMMADMAQAIQNLAYPGHMLDGQPAAERQQHVDVNDVVGNALAEASRVTTITEVMPAQRSEGVRHVGTRAPTPFTRGMPRHLQNAFGD